MHTWTLTIEQTDNRLQRASGDVPGRAEAAAALVAAADRDIRDMSVPTRYTFDIDEETVAVLVSNDDGNGRLDSAATLELLERINLVENTTTPTVGP